jgi:hypothetical protein
LWAKQQQLEDDYQLNLSPLPFLREIIFDELIILGPYYR